MFGKYNKYKTIEDDNDDNIFNNIVKKEFSEEFEKCDNDEDFDNLKHYIIERYIDNLSFCETELITENYGIMNAIKLYVNEYGSYETVNSDYQNFNKLSYIIVSEWFNDRYKTFIDFKEFYESYTAEYSDSEESDDEDDKVIRSINSIINDIINTVIYV